MKYKVWFDNTNFVEVSSTEFQPSSI